MKNFGLPLKTPYCFENIIFAIADLTKIVSLPGLGLGRGKGLGLGRGLGLIIGMERPPEKQHK